MSSTKTKKSTRRELLNKLWDLGRIMSTQMVFLHQALGPERRLERHRYQVH